MYYIGIDLGGTTTKAGLLNSNYEIVQRATSVSGMLKTQDEILSDIINLSRELMHKENVTEKDVHSIGIGCPGITIPKEGFVISCPNISFSNVDMKTEIQKYLDLDVYVENDANLAALAEVIAGAAQGTTNTIVITLGTGVGGGIIIDGKIYRGSFWGAGEVGHQVIKFDNGHLCGCGKTGCWEQYASATALIRDAKEAILNTNSTLLELSEDNITAKTIFEAANKGDLVAKDILDKYLYFVALGLTNLINVLQPEVILIGGGMSAQKEKLIEPIKNHISSLLSHGQDLKTEIKCAILGNDAGIIGAGLLGTTFNN